MTNDGSMITRGRPFGGKAWLIDRSIKVYKYECLNNDISYVQIEVDKGNNNLIAMIIVGVYLAFDDQSRETYARFKSNMQAIKTICNDNFKVQYSLLEILMLTLIEIIGLIRSLLDY